LKDYSIATSRCDTCLGVDLDAELTYVCDAHEAGFSPLILSAPPAVVYSASTFCG